MFAPKSPFGSFRAMPKGTRQRRNKITTQPNGGIRPCGMYRRSAINGGRPQVAPTGAAIIDPSNGKGRALALRERADDIRQMTLAVPAGGGTTPSALLTTAPRFSLSCCAPSATGNKSSDCANKHPGFQPSLVCRHPLRPYCPAPGRSALLSIKTPSPQLSYTAAGGLLLIRIFQWTVTYFP